MCNGKHINWLGLYGLFSISTKLHKKQVTGILLQ